MTALLTALVVLAIPFLAVSALLVLAERREDRRQLARDRQIALTDAIHWELGAVVAPTVTRRPGGGWRGTSGRRVYPGGVSAKTGDDWSSANRLWFASSNRYSPLI